MQQFANFFFVVGSTCTQNKSTGNQPGPKLTPSYCLIVWSFSTTGTLRIMMKPILTSYDLSGLYSLFDKLVPLRSMYWVERQHSIMHLFHIFYPEHRQSIANQQYIHGCTTDGCTNHGCTIDGCTTDRFTIMGVPLMGVPLIRSMYRVEPQHSTYILRSLRSSPTQQVLIGVIRF